MFPMIFLGIINMIPCSKIVLYSGTSIKCTPLRLSYKRQSPSDLSHSIEGQTYFSKAYLQEVTTAVEV